MNWSYLPIKQDVNRLTLEERAWLKQKHTIRVHLPEHPPYIYFKDGKPVGAAVDFLHAVSRDLGVEFTYTKAYRPFPNALRGLIQRDGPDLLASLNPTPEREKVILFTKPYVSTPRFIFTRDDAPFVASMESLSGKTVAVIKSYLVHRSLRENYPDIGRERGGMGDGAAPDRPFRDP